MADAPIVNPKEFKDTPQDWAKRWTVEMAASEKEFQKLLKSCDDIERRFLDKREGQNEGDTRVNLFFANVITLRSLLYGKDPEVDVARRFADQADGTARVAGELLERLLNTDLERKGDGFKQALRHSLSDFLLYDLAVARVRYEAEFEDYEVEAKTDDTGKELAPAYKDTRKLNEPEEDVCTEWYHRSCVRWSPARVWEEVRWVGFLSYMTRAALVKRFGEDIGNKVPLNSKRDKAAKQNDWSKADPWSRAEVWEIWDKEHKRVFWWVKGFGQVLDDQEDPLELEGFFPCPRPLMVNGTTGAFMPRPTYALVQDLYNEIDLLSTRITLLQRAVRVTGIYDKNSVGTQRLLSEGSENELIPVDGFAMLMEKGGLKGSIEWFPVEQVVAALDKLVAMRQTYMELLFEVSGMSDIMRGQMQDAQETATATRKRGRYSSKRVQFLQDEFARFASELQELRAEVIAKHFEPETILKRSNIQFAPEDQQQVMDAITMLKEDFPGYRVIIRPEALAQDDYDELKQERNEFLMGLGSFMAAMQPVLQTLGPPALPYLLELLKWSMQGYRGAASIEGVLDRAIAQAQQAAAQPQQPQQQDPKLMAAMFKAQADQQRIAAELHADLQRTQAETQSEVARERAQMQADLIVAQAQARAKIETAQAQHALRPPPAPVQPGRAPLRPVQGGRR